MTGHKSGTIKVPQSVESGDPAIDTADRQHGQQAASVEYVACKDDLVLNDLDDQAARRVRRTHRNHSQGDTTQVELSGVLEHALRRAGDLNASGREPQSPLGRARHCRPFTSDPRCGLGGGYDLRPSCPKGGRCPGCGEVASWY